MTLPIFEVLVTAAKSSHGQGEDQPTVVNGIDKKKVASINDV